MPAAGDIPAFIFVQAAVLSEIRGTRDETSLLHFYEISETDG